MLARARAFIEASKSFPGVVVTSTSTVENKRYEQHDDDVVKVQQDDVSAAYVSTNLKFIYSFSHYSFTDPHIILTQTNITQTHRKGSSSVLRLQTDQKTVCTQTTKKENKKSRRWNIRCCFESTIHRSSEEDEDTFR